MLQIFLLVPFSVLRISLSIQRPVQCPGISSHMVPYTGTLFVILLFNYKILVVQASSNMAKPIKVSFAPLFMNIFTSLDIIVNIYVLVGVGSGREFY